MELSKSVDCIPWSEIKVLIPFIHISYHTGFVCCNIDMYTFFQVHHRANEKCEKLVLTLLLFFISKVIAILQCEISCDRDFLSL